MSRKSTRNIDVIIYWVCDCHTEGRVGRVFCFIFLSLSPRVWKFQGPWMVGFTQVFDDVGETPNSTVATVSVNWTLNFDPHPLPLTSTLVKILRSFNLYKKSAEMSVLTHQKDLFALCIRSYALILSFYESLLWLLTRYAQIFRNFSD